MSAYVLYAFWRSGTSHRLRIALNLKGLDYRIVPVNLRAAEHKTPNFLALNPQGLLPVLDTGAAPLTQSLAILEWLEETCPDPPLLPKSPDERQIVRAMAAAVACDIHPLNNVRVLNALRTDFGASEDQVRAWIARWIGDGFAAVERMIERHGDGFAYGSGPTVADCCLVPQVYSAERFGVDLAPYPRIVAAAAAANALPAFEQASPERQPDAQPG